MKSDMPYFHGGSEVNPLESEYHVCYWIKSPDGRFYVGSNSGVGKVHAVGELYFTSSTDSEFKDQFRSCSQEFQVTVRYFMNKEESVAEEYRILKENNVRGNQLFINKIAIPNNTCGAGTVSVKGGKRIPIKEYRGGGYEHVSSGCENVYIRETGELVKIDSATFDASKHIRELEGMVHCTDLETGKNIRISKVEFDSNKGRFVGVTKGLVSCWDTKEKKFASATKEEFDGVRYVGVTSKQSPLFKEGLRTGQNSGYVVVFDLVVRKPVRITKDEYRKQKSRYLNAASKGVYYVDGMFFTNRSKMKTDLLHRAVFIDKQDLKNEYLEITKHEN